MVLPLLVLLAGALSGGCMTAGVAALGPLASVAGYLLDRGVDRTFAADLPHVWEATLVTLRQMQIPVDAADRDEQRGQISAAAGGMTISGEMARVTGGMTRVALTVNGGIRPDKETAKEILDRVALLIQDEATEVAAARAEVRARAHLASTGRGRPPGSGQDVIKGAASDHARAIERELEALRAEIAALREFRASLARDFGALRSNLAMRLTPVRDPEGSPGEPEAADRSGGPSRKISERAPAFRVREMVVREGDVPGSVLVVSPVGPELGGQDSPSQVLQVDPERVLSFARASAPPRATFAGPGRVGPLGAVGFLAPVQSFLRPTADLATEGSVPPAPPQ